jgi:hypothetical protein
MANQRTRSPGRSKKRNEPRSESSIDPLARPGRILMVKAAIC